jgi:HAD superfamily hydrolase (TIGR01509 family)
MEDVMKTLNGDNRGRNNNKIRSVIFDFDGTLADTQGAVNLAFLNTLKEIGAPIPLSPFLDAISSFTLEGMFRAVGFTEKKMLMAAICRYQDLYKTISLQKTRLFAGVIQTLNTLYELNLSLSIATNESRNNLENLIPSLGIRNYFTVTVCENEVIRPKPFPEMVNKILQKTGSSPAETLIVGDSVLDMAVGKVTGCYTCAAAYGTHSREKLRFFSPDWIINCPSELLGILGISNYPETIKLTSSLPQFGQHLARRNIDFQVGLPL